MRYSVLGPLEVTDEVDAVTIGGPKPKSLLIALLARANRLVSVDEIIEVLWGDGKPESASGTVRAYVSRLRRVLGASALPSRSSGYLLRVGLDDLDAAVFESMVDRARVDVAEQDHGSALERLTAALSLWRGHAYQERTFDTLADAEALRLESVRTRVIEERIETFLALGRHSEAIPDLEAALLEHPLREKLWQMLMLALYRSGRQVDALRAYRRAEEHLREEAGLLPGAALQQLEGLILERSPTLDAPPPKRRVVRSRVDSAGVALVGRLRDVEAIHRVLARERIVTLTGPGGVGKTSLAREAIARLDGEAGEPSILIELATIEDATDLPERLASLLDIDTSEFGTTLEALDAWVASRGGVIVLDNCEHLIEEVAVLVEHWIRSGDATFLATSREPLGVDGECLHPVSTLEVPSESELDEPQLIASRDAVVLFVERARVARSGFEPTDDDLVAIGEICRRLDGLPLALELAAARLAIMSARDVADRLERRFRILTTARLPLPDRQRTLEAAIRWSYDLLDDDERLAFETLGVFESTFDLPAIEAMLTDRPDLLDVIDGLVSKHLLLVDHGDRTRYRQLESIRAFARAALHQRSDSTEVERRHARYYAGRVHRTWTAEGEREPFAARRAIDAELPNLRVALAWLIENEAEEAERVLADLGRYWRSSRLLDEGARWTEAAMNASEGADLAIRASAANTLAAFHVRRGEHERAKHWLTESLRLAEGSGDLLTSGRARNNLGVLNVELGDLDAAVHHYRQALELYDRVDHGAGRLSVLGNLAVLEMERGNVDAALGFNRAHLDASRSQGDRRQQVRALINIGVTHFMMSDLHAAEVSVQEAIDSVAGGEMDDLLAPALQTLAEICVVQDRLDEAEERARESIRLALDVRFATVADGLMTLAEVAAGRTQFSQCAYLVGMSEASRVYLSPPPALAEERRATRLTAAREELGRRFDALAERGSGADRDDIRRLAEGGLADFSPPGVT